MADLEKLGFITSPHTSAGRVPTPLGYRLFVDSLISVRPLDDDAAIKTLKQTLNPELSAAELVSSASRLLSSTTMQAGLVTLPKRKSANITHIDFVALSGNRILIILVIDGEDVQNRIIRTHRPFSEKELQEAARFLNSNYTGQPLEQARSQLLATLEQEKDSLNNMMNDALQFARQAFETDDNNDDYIVSGQTQLINGSQPDDLQRIRHLFEAFNHKQDILHLLDNCVKANGVQIFIGRESGFSVLEDYSLVTSTYHKHDDVVGVLGVIGPTRMAYDRVIQIVDATSRILSAALSQKSSS